MAGATLAQGASVTLTLAATDSVLIDSAAGGSARFEAASGVAGSSGAQVLAYHPGGKRTYGPFGAGTVKLYTIGGSLQYTTGTAPLSDDDEYGKFSSDAIVTSTADMGPYIQARINENRPVYLPDGTTYCGQSLVPGSSGRIDIQGSGTRYCTLQAASSFTSGYLISPSGSYNLSGFRAQGLSNSDGLYLLGNNTAAAGGGVVVLRDMDFRLADIAVNFGEEYEHPLGLLYDNVYIQGVRTGGINLGGVSGAATSGESNWQFNDVVITNNGGAGIEYTQSAVQVNTPSTSFDRLTWSGTVPYYGFLVQRSANGSTLWHVPPNWSSSYFTSLTFDAAKTIGETWFYKVIRCTRGFSGRRGKNLDFGSFQMEYFGIGAYLEDVNGFNISALYSETRDSAVPYGNFCGLFAKNSYGKVGTFWTESMGYGIVSASNSNIVVDTGRANNGGVNGPSAAFGLIGSTDQYISVGGASNSGTTENLFYDPESSANNKNWDVLDYSSTRLRRTISHKTRPEIALAHRGVDKSTWYYDATNGSNLDLNRLQVSPISKNYLARNQNSTQFTSLTNNVATAFMTITVPTGYAGGVTIDYGIQIFDNGSVKRQSVAGRINVAIVSPAGTATAAVESVSFAKALAAGTLTDPAFTTSVTGNVVTLLCSINTNAALGGIRLFAHVNSDLGGLSTSFTQL